MLFDSHAHLQFSAFDNDRQKVIDDLERSDIKVVNVGTNLEDSKLALNLAKKYSGQMWATVGLHPNDALGTFFAFDDYKKLAQDESVVAIGECGLDYFRTESKAAREKQKEVFAQQIALAKALGKPLMIHARAKEGDDAYLDLLEILRFENLNISGGNGTAHFFAGSINTAKQFLDLGFYISFAGPVTFADSYKEAIEYVPLDRILVETDAPFAAPVPHRGKRNEPAFVEFVARKIAEWKNLDFEKVARQTAENAEKLFGIK